MAWESCRREPSIHRRIRRDRRPRGVGTGSHVGPALADIIISIEHLPPEILPQFAPVLLGVYRPRILIVTTPSFDFNERFSRPGTVDRKGYKDPTGALSLSFTRGGCH